jgi:magnesium transporter
LVNLVTAFLATRFTGLFESTIANLVALATLMPIVASIGGNTGNQTVALVIRGLAFDQITRANMAYVLRKEVMVGLVNGVLWGGLVGLVGIVLYRSMSLGIVLMAAVLLNLVIAAVVGVIVPLMLQRVGRDPAQGASVLLTFVTDSMGFFLLLGLAQLLL